MCIYNLLHSTKSLRVPGLISLGTVSPYLPMNRRPLGTPRPTLEDFFEKNTLKFFQSVFQSIQSNQWEDASNQQAPYTQGECICPQCIQAFATLVDSTIVFLKAFS